MTGHGKHAGEPVDAEPRDPYGLGPNARISVGGYFPAKTGGPPGEPARSSVSSGSPLYAVALVAPSWILHAVPWKAATPGVKARAACAIEARVADIAGSRVIWFVLDRMTCEDCAVVVTGAARQEGQP